MGRLGRAAIFFYARQTCVSSRGGYCGTAERYDTVIGWSQQLRDMFIERKLESPLSCAAYNCSSPV